MRALSMLAMLAALLSPSVARAAACENASCLCDVSDPAAVTVLRATVTSVEGARTRVNVNEEVGADSAFRPADSLNLPRAEGDREGRRLLLLVRHDEVVRRVELNASDEAVCPESPTFKLPEQQAIRAVQLSREECQAAVSAAGWEPPPCPCGCSAAGAAPWPLMGIATLLLVRRRQSASTARSGSSGA
ncbi:MAG: hypothetical protein ACK4N5_00625 [Myxococcales bacterium]